MIWEIFNKCSGNQMRDVFFDEIETDDPDAYIAGRFRDGYDILRADEPVTGTLVFEIRKEGLLQRISLTEI
jgi:hypothetical protein